MTTYEGGADDGDSGDPADERLDAYPLSLDAMLDLLANRERRTLLRYLRETTDDDISFQAGVRHLLAENATVRGKQPSSTDVKTELRHIHLPKLADAGIIEFDARSGVIRYRGDDRLETLLDRLEDLESV